MPVTLLKLASALNKKKKEYWLTQFLALLSSGLASFVGIFFPGSSKDGPLPFQVHILSILETSDKMARYLPSKNHMNLQRGFWMAFLEFFLLGQ